MDDNRGRFTSAITNNNIQQNNTPIYNQNKTFASATKQKSTINPPNKNQALVLSYNEDTPIEEYIYKIGDIVGPTNISHFYKIFNRRLCIFLTSKELVDKFIAEHPTMVVANQVVEIRKYINPGIRLVISNVCASISNEIIENSLKQNGLTMISPITCLKAGLEKEGYQHILGSRRQVLLPPNFDGPIPSNIEIYFEETRYKIYLMADIICVACKQKGHNINWCPNVEIPSNLILAQNEINVPNEQPTHIENTLSDNIGKNANLSHENNSENASMHPIDETMNTSQEENIVVLSQNQTNNQPEDDQENNLSIFKTKRHAISISSIDDEDIEKGETQKQTKLGTIPKQKKTNTGKSTNDKGKQKQKKLRSESPDTNSQNIIDETLSPVKKEMENSPTLYTITFEELKTFLDKIQGSSEHLKIAREFSKDITGLLLTLKDLYQFLDDRSLKIRFTRIINKIRDQQKEETENHIPNSK